MKTIRNYLGRSARVLLASLTVAMLAPAPHIGNALAADLNPSPVDKGSTLAVTDAQKCVVKIDVVIAEFHRSSEGDISSGYTTSYGSGVIVRRDGMILTNAHVVADAQFMLITLADGRKLQGRLVGADRATDIAVVKVDMQTDDVMSLGDGALSPGDSIVAIGAPFGWQGSISSGEVSGIRRALRESTPNWFVQHTASVNPGSSGGPLLDAAGRMVGINTAIPDSQFSFAGIGLAIPLSTVRPVAQAIMETGRFEHGRLGAAFTDIDFLSAWAAGRPTLAGAIVLAVDAVGPAASAGLQIGDRVLSIGGSPVDSLSSLLSVTMLARSGEVIELEILRQDQRIKLAFVLGSHALAAAEADTPEPPRALGIETTDAASGVEIARVQSNSWAEKIGLRSGDRIHAINFMAISSAEAAQALLSKSAARATLIVSRGDTPARLVVLGAHNGKTGTMDGNNLGILSAWT